MPRFSLPLPLNVCGSGGGVVWVVLVAVAGGDDLVSGVDGVTSAGELVVPELLDDLFTAAAITPMITRTTTTPPMAARHPFTASGTLSPYAASANVGSGSVWMDPRRDTTRRWRFPLCRPRQLRDLGSRCRLRGTSSQASRKASS